MSDYQERQDSYALACSDPGAFTPRGDNYAESIPRWSARAAIIVADAEQAELRAEVARLTELVETYAMTTKD